ncbi:MFS transporter [Longispora albida]|uniref:MFS transporter n=1 Tax=Longispora albida TaxID=203523 RepID=UPI00035D3ED8|nr:MFS transporter [Longispora albida]
MTGEAGLFGRRTGLISLLAAEAISMFGSRIAGFAVSWLVLLTTGDPVKMGMIATSAVLPYVLSAAFGTPLIDRLGARRLTIGADVLSGLLVGAIALVYRDSFPLLIAVVAIAGASSGLGDHARRVVLTAQVKYSGVETTRATSLYDGIARLSTLIGAPLGGVVIAWVGGVEAILINAASFVVCALITLFLVPTPAGSIAEARPVKEPYFTALRGGFVFVWQDKLILAVLSMLFVTNMCNQAHNLFIPLWIKEVLNSPIGLGTIPGAFALGAVIGNVVMTALAAKVPRYVTLVVCYLIGGAPRFLVLGLSDQLAVVLSVTFLTGLLMSSVNPIIGAMLMERTPDGMQARVFGLSTAVAWGGIPLGSMLGAFLAGQAGIAVAATITGIVYFGATLTPVFGAKTWRKLDRDKTSPEPSPVG